MVPARGWSQTLGLCLVVPGPGLFSNGPGPWDLVPGTGPSSDGLSPGPLSNVPGHWDLVLSKWPRPWTRALGLARVASIIMDIPPAHVAMHDLAGP